MRLKRILLVAAALSTTTAFGGSVLSNNCNFEIGKFCNEMKPGNGRITRCLADHKKELSAPCIDELEKQKKLKKPSRAEKTTSKPSES